MNQQWQEFLAQAGAQIEHGQVTDFGDPEGELAAAVDSDTIADLSHFTLVKVSGADAATFLQGQFSNDLREVNAGHSQLSSYCSPKGRILAAFRVFKRGEDYYLKMPAEVAERTLKRLRMFVLMSKVTLEPDDSLVAIGVTGPNAASLLGGHFSNLPDDEDQAVEQDGVTLIKVRGNSNRFEVYAPRQGAQGLWQAISGSARAIGAAGWSLQDIRAGLPNVYGGTVEAFVPQMLNLHVVNGVSFKKGCYPGQEVVARMQYLGKLKRRMYLAHVDSDALPDVGTELSCTNSDSGQGAGKVVTASATPDGGYDALVVAQIANVEAGDEFRLGDDGPRLEFRELPYAVPSDGAATQ